MAIGERIHHFRLLRGFAEVFRAATQVQRITVRCPCAQYEKGAHQSKENYLNALADIFDVSRMHWLSQISTAM